MKWVGVLPWIYRQYYDECVATMHPDFRKHVVEIDNTKNNLGIMISHNLGVQKMRQEDADWLVVLSAAIRFEAGGLDFIDQLDSKYICISASNKKLWESQQQVGVFGWHCIAFSRECIEKVGLWDANFSPYGYDDIDYSIRMQKAFPDPEYSQRTTKVQVLVHDTTMAHSINLVGIQTDNQKNIDYIERKWGVILHGPEKENDIRKHFKTPFGDPELSLKYWPMVTYLGKEYLWNE